jgi:hypothetical protein
MKISTLLLFTIISLNYFGQGLILDSIAFKKSPLWEADENYGYASMLPAKISYRAYTPAVLDQGNTATCVGYSVAYSQLSTQQNILMGVTNEYQKLFRAMDPNFIYSLIREMGDLWCEKGTSMIDAFSVLKSYGCKPMIWSPWLTCNDHKVALEDFTLAVASNYAINNYAAIPMDVNVINSVKKALQQRLIVSCGIQLTESFAKGSSVSFGNYSPRKGESFIGGHAMCVIGYDDNRNGGSFEVMNSYGSKYGDKGFVWIKYADFYNLVSEAYIVILEDFKKGNCSFGDCANSFSRYRFENGSIYEGMIKNNRPEIFGSYVYPTGNFYVGEFLAGRRHGYGLYYIASEGQYYETSFKNDVLIESAAIQGFAAKDSKEKIEQMITKILGENTKVIKDDSDLYKKLMDELEVPEKELVIK